MYSYKYGYQTILTVSQSLDLFDMTYEDGLEEDWSPSIYLGSVFILSALMMPLFLYLMFVTKRFDTIEEAACQILETRFGFERKDDQ